jgi:cytochrome c oxidase assembly factor 7
MNNSMSCFYISGMFISGVEQVLTKDMTKAFEYSQKACHLGNVYACANLSQMYKKVSDEWIC